VSADFPEYAFKEHRDAVTSKSGFSSEQMRVLNDIIREMADDPRRFEPLSTRTSAGALVFKDPASAIELTYIVDTHAKVLSFFHYSAPLPPRQTIFISYSRQDLRWLKLVRKFLIVLEQEGVITLWDDSAIKPGERWEQSIQKALDSACAALLLVSQDFVSSKFITTYELPRLLAAAKREGKKIFWIPLSAATVPGTITGFESLIEDPGTSLEDLSRPKRNRVLVQAYERLRGAMAVEGEPGRA